MLDQLLIEAVATVAKKMPSFLSEEGTRAHQERVAVNETMAAWGSMVAQQGQAGLRRQLDAVEDAKRAAEAAERVKEDDRLWEQERERRKAGRFEMLRV